MPNKPLPSNVISPSPEYSDQSQHILRAIREFSMSVTKIKNSLHQLLNKEPINALHDIKGFKLSTTLAKSPKDGLRLLTSEVQLTRQSIRRVFDELEIDKDKFGKNIEKPNAISNTSKLMFGKLYGGMRSCRKTIALLLDEEAIEISRRLCAESSSFMASVNELADLYDVLAIFETDDHEAIKKSLRQFQSR